LTDDRSPQAHPHAATHDLTHEFLYLVDFKICSELQSLEFSNSNSSINEDDNNTVLSTFGGMVRLTTEVVAKAPSYINPIKDRELDLRGNRIPQIENLAVSKVFPQFPNIPSTDKC
jgi:hypothetical protein